MHVAPSNEPPPPEPLENHPRYRKVKSLNKGSYGFVQLAQNLQTGEFVAIKFMERGDKITKYVEREIINHRKLFHPHVIQFKEVFLTQHYLAIAMEYAAGGDMFQLVKQRRGLPETEARWFFQQLIIGLDYCHKMGVANRDIKLENTLIDASRRPLLKICDFGYSKNENDSLSKSKVGTPGYTAPEVVINSKYDGALADVWSAGVMLYVMLFCQYPFERAEDENDKLRLQRVLTRIMQMDYHLPQDIPISAECRHLLSQILVADPSKRLTIHAIQQHPWFTKDLPPGLNEFNDNCLRKQQARQTPQDKQAIAAIVNEAKYRVDRLPLESAYADDAYDYMTDEAMAEHPSL